MATKSAQEKYHEAQVAFEQLQRHAGGPRSEPEEAAYQRLKRQLPRLKRAADAEKEAAAPAKNQQAVNEHLSEAASLRAEANRILADRTSSDLERQRAESMLYRAGQAETRGMALAASAPVTPTKPSKAKATKKATIAGQVHPDVPPPVRAAEAVQPAKAAAPVAKATPRGSTGSGTRTQPAKAVVVKKAGDTTTPVTEPSGETTDQAIYRRFGYGAWTLTDPVFKDAVAAAIKNPELGFNEFRAILEKNPQWHTMQDETRSWYVLTRDHPADAADRRTQQTAAVTRMAEQLGVTLGPDRAAKIAEDSLSQGWSTDDDRLTRALAAEAHYDPSANTGQKPGISAGSIGYRAQQYKAMAQNEYLLPLTDAEAYDFAKKEYEGTSNENGFRTMMSGRASEHFAGDQGLVKSISAGLTPKMALAPITSMIASNLDIASDAVDYLNDPRFAPILGRYDDTAKATRPMTYAEALAHVRGLPDFTQSSKGRELYAGTTAGLLESLGLK